jgi:hypothetical protein
VRVARRLEEMPLVRSAFARGELSYSKVRALTRLGPIESEAELLELARHATSAHLERIVRGYRGVLAAEGDRAYRERFLSFSHEDDGSLVIRGRLPAEEGALLLKALEVAREGLAADQPRDQAGDAERVPDARTHPADVTNADALAHVAESVLSHGAGSSTTADRFQVVVHVDSQVLSSDDAAGRCETEHGAPLSPAAAQRLTCDASLVAMVQRSGQALALGRKNRSLSTALRRALHARDGGCRFPGCTARRRVDAHHIEHWARGGRTDLTNLVALCRHHHRLVHEGGFCVETLGSGRLAFVGPDGRRISPAPRPPRGDCGELLRRQRRAGLEVDPETCVPLWSGENLDLGMAVDAVLAWRAPPAGVPG